MVDDTYYLEYRDTDCGPHSRWYRDKLLPLNYDQAVEQVGWERKTWRDMREWQWRVVRITEGVTTL